MMTAYQNPWGYYWNGSTMVPKTEEQYHYDMVMSKLAEIEQRLAKLEPKA